LQKYFFIAVGGALGAMSRVWVDSAVTDRLGIRFPYGTFVVNLSACVILGFSLAFLNRRMGLNPIWVWLIPVGFVGAYSTFSTFEWETLSTLQSGAVLMAALYAFLSVVLGLLGTWCGAWIARAIS
jgi:CrcB protein